MSGAPFKYVEHGHTMNRKFSKSLRKQSFEWKMGVSNEVEKLWGYASKRTHFSLKTFVSQALRKFSVRRISMINIFKRCAWHSLLRYRKNRERSTRQTDYMLGNAKKCGFLLWKSSWEAMWPCFQKIHFSLKTFFHKLLENFLLIVWPFFDKFQVCV